MNTKLQKENSRIQRVMQAKAANGKTVPTSKTNAKPKPVKTHTVKPAPTPEIKTRRASLKNTTPQLSAVEPKVVESKPVEVIQDKPTNRLSDQPTKAGQHIILRAGALKAALNAVERACAKKSTLPILSTILIQTVSDTGIKLTATNLDLTLWHLADAEVLQPGAVCVPLLMADLLAKVKDDTLVTLQTDAKTFVVKMQAGRIVTHIKASDPTEFPPPNVFNGDTVRVGMDLMHETLIEIAKRVIPFAATDDARPLLTGIGITAPLPKHSGEDVTIIFAAADGYRLAYLKREAALHVENLPNEKFAVVVPAKFFGEILKLSPDESKPIPFVFHLRFDKKGVLEMGMVEVNLGTSGLRVNLLDGNFPDYTQIDKEPPHAPIIPIAVAETVAAVERASLFNDASTVRLAPNVQAGQILIQSSSADDGDFQEVLPAEFDAERAVADGYEIAFNARYLSDALKAVSYLDGAKPLALRVTEPSKPAFLSAPRYRVVLMPMHVGDNAKPQTQERSVSNAPAAPAPTETKETQPQAEKPAAAKQKSEKEKERSVSHKPNKTK